MRHTQIFVRAEVKRPLLTAVRADAFIRKAVAVAGMKIIGGPYSVTGIIPGNEGVSSVVVLDFSSAALHEWPDAIPYPLIHFDLYTCGSPSALLEVEKLFDTLDCVSRHTKIIDRDEFLGVR